VTVTNALGTEVKVEATFIVRVTSSPADRQVTWSATCEVCGTDLPLEDRPLTRGSMEIVGAALACHRCDGPDFLWGGTSLPVLVDAGENWQNLRNGLYRMYWKSGGSSLVAIGRTSEGSVWFAPTNWVAWRGAAGSAGCGDWSMILGVSPILVPGAGEDPT
jgi:hypothetical protein